MRVIDIYANDDIANEFEQRAKDLGHRVSHAEGSEMALRVIVESGEPDEFLEDLRSRLDETEDDSQYYVVFEPVAVAPRIENDEPQGNSWTATTDEIESFVVEGARLTRVYIVLSAVAGILATIGLLRGSPAVLVGAMVLAPVFKPMASAGAGVLLGRVREAFIGIGLLAGSLAVAAIAGGAVTLLTPGPPVTHALELRASISPFDLIIALCSGVAMGYTLMHRDAMSMVGIVVAASLVPVASALGVAGAMLDLDLILGATFTLTSNIAGILVGLIATCQFEQLRRTGTFRQKEEDGKRLANKGLILGGAILALLIAINIWSAATTANDKPDLNKQLVADLTALPGVQWVDLQTAAPALVYKQRTAISAEATEEIKAILTKASYEHGLVIIPTE